MAVMAVQQQTLHSRQSTTARRTNQKVSRVSNKKVKWSHKENQFLWECYESCYPLPNDYKARIHMLCRMSNLPAQRLSTLVKNIEKELILSRVERQQIYANVMGNNQEMDNEEITINEKMRTDKGKPPEELDIKNDETHYDPEMIRELFGESFDESYEFEGFKEEETHNPKNHLIADRIKAVSEKGKVKNKQPCNIKNVEWRKVKIEIEKVESTIENIKTKNLADLNYLLKAAGIVIAERLGIKQKLENNRKSKSNKDPWWKRRLEKNIKEWRKDESKLEEVKQGNHRLSMSEKVCMNWKYQLDAKDYLYVIQQLTVKKYQELVSISDSEIRISENITKISCLRPINLGCTVNSMMITIP